MSELPREQDGTALKRLARLDAANVTVLNSTRSLCSFSFDTLAEDIWHWGQCGQSSVVCETAFVFVRAPQVENDTGERRLLYDVSSLCNTVL